MIPAIHHEPELYRFRSPGNLCLVELRLNPRLRLWDRTKHVPRVLVIQDVMKCSTCLRLAVRSAEIPI